MINYLYYYSYAPPGYNGLKQPKVWVGVSVLEKSIKWNDGENRRKSTALRSQQTSSLFNEYDITYIIQQV